MDNQELALLVERFKNDEKKGNGFIPEADPQPPMSGDLLGFEPFADNSSLPTTPVLDQGQASTCLPHAFVEGMLIRMLVQGTVCPRLYSILFLYYFGRSDPKIDSGMQFSNAISTFATRGLPSEEHWPYDSGEVYKSPPIEAIQHAYDQRGLIKAHPLNGSTDAMRSLCSGCPVVAGFRNTFGGPHAVLLVGHRKAAGEGYEVLVKNSWGVYFGEDGYIWLSASLLDDPYEQIGLWSIDYVPSPSEDYATLGSEISNR